MSQSMLYHAFGIKGVTYRSTAYIGNAVIFNVETTNHHIQCCVCNQKWSGFLDHHLAVIS